MKTLSTFLINLALCLHCAFAQTTNYTLSINTTNGQVYKRFVSDNTYTSASSFAAGTQLRLYASGDWTKGYIFQSWSGGVSGNLNPITITMDSNKTVTANFVQASQNIPKANGLIVETFTNLPVSQTNHARLLPINGPVPAKGTPYPIPITNLTMTRISDLTDGPSFMTTPIGNPSLGLHNGYSKYTNVNKSGRYALAFYTNGSTALLYDLYTNQFMKVIESKKVGSPSGGPLGEAFDVRWDLSGNPGTDTVIYYKAAAFLGIAKQDVLIGPSSEEVIYDFSKDPRFSGISGLYMASEGHMDQSTDARYRAVRLQTEQGFRQVAIVDQKEKKILPAIIDKAVAGNQGVDVSLSGQWIYVSNAEGALYDQANYRDNRPYQFFRTADLAAGIKNKGVFLPTSSHGHDGWAYDKNGREVFLYQDNPTDWFSAFEPGTQTRTDVFNMRETGYNFGQHMSRMSNPGLRGWFFMATYTQPCTDDWASNQFLMIEIANYNRKNSDGSANPPRLWRIGSSQNGPNTVCGSDKDYFAEGFAMLDYEGKNIFVGSNWNRKDNLELYKLELPTTWYETLNGNIKYPQAPTGLIIKN